MRRSRDPEGSIQAALLRQALRLTVAINLMKTTLPTTSCISFNKNFLFFFPDNWISGKLWCSVFRFQSKNNIELQFQFCSWLIIICGGNSPDSCSSHQNLSNDIQLAIVRIFLHLDINSADYDVIFRLHNVCFWISFKVSKRHIGIYYSIIFHETVYYSLFSLLT